MTYKDIHRGDLVRLKTLEELRAEFPQHHFEGDYFYPCDGMRKRPISRTLEKLGGGVFAIGAKSAYRAFDPRVELRDIQHGSYIATVGLYALELVKGSKPEAVDRITNKELFALLEV